MMINGTDYSLPLFAVLSFFVMFGVQFFLLRMKRPRLLRHLPWVWVILILAVAIAALFGDTGGWIDIRTFFCALFCAYAAICAAGIGLATLFSNGKIDKKSGLSARFFRTGAGAPNRFPRGEAVASRLFGTDW